MFCRWLRKSAAVPRRGSFESRIAGTALNVES